MIRALLWCTTIRRATGRGAVRPRPAGVARAVQSSRISLIRFGAAWKNNSTGLLFSSLGKLYEVNASSMVTTMVKDVDPTLSACNGNFTALTYNPSVSPYIYATYGGFDAIALATLNKLYVLDPANSYNVVKTINLSTSLQTVIARLTQAVIFS